MKIILMRHGRPELDLEHIKSKKMSPIDVGKVVQDYEQTNLAHDSTPPQRQLDIAQNCDRAFCSDLPRAVGSIKKLGIEDKASVDPEFQESALPYLTWQSPRLSFFNWCIIFRVLWLFGFSRNGEAIAAAKKRAKNCVAKLTHNARADDTILFLGHGIINRLIARELKKQSWQKLSGSNEQYWSCVSYEK